MRRYVDIDSVTERRIPIGIRDRAVCECATTKSPAVAGDRLTLDNLAKPEEHKPTIGFEPMACGLRNRCSTTEPRRHNRGERDIISQAADAMSRKSYGFPLA